jgi:3-deoxy-D-manno-octulosonic-acid transferase
MLSGTLPAGSSRLRGPARALLAPAYARLHHVAAISPEDAERFGALGVPAQRRSVMGDARFDQVWARAAAVDRTSLLLAPLAGFAGVTLVAGSTWPPDEEQLLPAVRSVIDAGHPLRLVLVPHEPTPAHLAAAEARLDALGLRHARLAAVLTGAAVPDVVVVDRVGVLGDLYAAADLAYVGGGFGTAGLHSVLEPAAFGVPVLFGPRHANAREAAELIALGGAVVAADGAALRETLAALASDAADRARGGAIAREYVRAGLGAAERGAGVVEELLGGH